jgi:glycerophosphoryl diester phosphodiesterase
VTEPLVREIVLRCGPNHAFAAFTTHVDAWWPRGHRRNAEGTLTFEPRSGGRLVDVAPDGSGAWDQVEPHFHHATQALWEEVLGRRALRNILVTIVVVLVAFAVTALLYNASFFAAPPNNPRIRLIAHRGVHQNFDLAGVKNDTCTATRIRPPIVSEIENTIPAMQSAFAFGADAVELDVHPTTDGHLVVFHDWTLDCRTEGTGETRSHDLAYLKTLDVGYGYTADGGQTFPLRGTGVGTMPALEDVLAVMPTRRFIVNFKSNDAREGEMLTAFVAAHPEWKDAVWGAYGGDPPVRAAKAGLPDVRAWGQRQVIGCLTQYLATGWTGRVPGACRDTMVMVPINYAWLLWGWPNRFLQRMRDAGSEVILIGPYSPGDAGTSGIDTSEELAQVPPDFSGYVWTNRVDVIGPLLGRSGNSVATLR